MTAICVTGATGYIGSRLVPALLDAGHDVTCLARTPSKLEAAEWSGRVRVVEGDVLTGAGLLDALRGCETAYYLIHSIGSSDDWADRDVRAARAFRTACAEAGVRQIVYLGGLGEGGSELSEHLRSRHETGDELRAGSVPVTELRAAVVIGSGSASFEILRNLVENLPAMLTPRWVRTRCQPIAVDDILAYLVGVAGLDESLGRVLEVGGPDVLTYEEMMRRYATVRGLRRRLIVPVPVLSPGLSSLWIGLVTPLPPGLARPLVDSLTSEVVVRNDEIRSLVPRSLTPFDEAVRRATASLRRQEGAVEPADPGPLDPDWAGGALLVDRRRATAHASPDSVHRVLGSIGGQRGWFAYDALWVLRGAIDRLVGGPGLRRHRGPGPRPPLAVGHDLDFWEVEALEPGRLLRLRAEMRLPGRAWLEWQTEPDGARTILHQTASFAPSGLAGRLYWYALWPFHQLIFGRMCTRIAQAAEREAAAT